jgi:hypothetical protein
MLQRNTCCFARFCCSEPPYFNPVATYASDSTRTYGYAYPLPSLDGRGGPTDEAAALVSSPKVLHHSIFPLCIFTRSIFAAFAFRRFKATSTDSPSGAQPMIESFDSDDSKPQ